jgi:hypothetical protein
MLIVDAHSRYESAYPCTKIPSGVVMATANNVNDAFLILEHNKNTAKYRWASKKSPT